MNPNPRIAIPMLAVALAVALAPPPAAAQVFADEYGPAIRGAVAGGVFGPREVDAFVVESPTEPAGVFLVRLANPRLPLARIARDGDRPADLTVRIGDQRFDASRCRVANSAAHPARSAATELRVECKKIARRPAKSSLSAHQRTVLARYRTTRTAGGMSLAAVPRESEGEWADCLDNPDNEGSSREILHGCFCLLLGKDGDTGC